MNLRMLEEFVEFSKALNFSTAAKLLHMSQSSLSKHMSELERTIGFTLVSRDAPMTLTPAGKLFLESAEDILFRYNETLAACRRLQHQRQGHITVHDPLIDSTIGNQAISVFMHFSEHYPEVEVNLHTIRNQTVSEALDDGTVDIGYYMAYGDVEAIIEERAARGIVAVPLRQRRFSVWMKKDHPMAAKDHLYVADLEGSPFLIPADRLFDDWRIVLEKLCMDHGFFPRVNLKVTPTINGYFALNTKNGVVILSEAFLQDPRFLMREDMVVRELSDEDCAYTLFFVFKEGNPNPIVPLFAECLESTV